jgi:hypothetical protein
MYYYIAPEESAQRKAELEDYWLERIQSQMKPKALSKCVETMSVSDFALFVYDPKLASVTMDQNIKQTCLKLLIVTNNKLEV